MRSILCAALLALCAREAAAVVTWNMTVGGSARNLLLYAPTGLPAHPAAILQLHGMNQDAAYQQAQAKWEPIADTGKFLVVFPNGLNKSWDLSGNTDVNFMNAIIDTLYRKYSIDRGRVYISGFSMGGMFTYYAMNKLSDKIAAFAPCSGYPMGGASASATRPIPIIHIHGTADDVVSYGGVAGALQTWRTFDNCPATATTTKPYPADKPNSVTTRDFWGPCVKNGVSTEIVLLSNAGKGHWYSMDAASELSSVEIWNFCKRYSLTSGTSAEGRPAERVGASVRSEPGRLVVEGAELESVRLIDLRGTTIARWEGSPSPSAELPLGEVQGGIHMLEIVGGTGRELRRVLIP